MEPTVTCTGVVVSYDPVRRHGFVRILQPVKHARVHFVLGCLTPALKDQVVEASRLLNDSESRRLPPAAWQALLRQVSSLLVGRCFSMRLRQQRGGVIIERGSAERLSEADCDAAERLAAPGGGARGRHTPKAPGAGGQPGGNRSTPSTK